MASRRSVLKINGRLHYLWRAVDKDGEVLDILVQRHRDGKAAKKFFRKLLKDCDMSREWSLHAS
jgi:putative transposase